MAGTREHEIARQCVNLIHEAQHLNSSIRGEEVLDTAVKIYFGERDLDRVKFGRAIWSHAELNWWLERWRGLKASVTGWFS